MAEIAFKRIFHPVGQGAFFTEHIMSSQNRIHIIYDCGSMSRKRINDEIIDFSNINFKGDHIACIFISHFDMDHVNGLDKLRKEFSVDEKTLVFVPFFYEEVYVYLNKFNNTYWKGYNCLKKFIEKTNAHVIKVLPYTNDESQEAPFVITPDNRIIDNRKEIQSGTLVHIQNEELNIIWKYIPYNITDNHTIEGIVLEDLQKAGAIKDGKFNVELLSYPIKGMGQEEKKIMSAMRQKLRRIFSTKGNGNESQNINMNSLQLLSLPNDPLACRDYYRYSICDSYYGDFYRWNRGYMRYKFEKEKLYPGSCLYTGDTFANSKDFWRAFNAILCSNMTKDHSRLSLFQIPHHGSKRSNDDRIVNSNSIYASFTNFDPDYFQKIFNPEICMLYYLKQKPLILVTKEDEFRFEENWMLNK